VQIVLQSVLQCVCCSVCCTMSARDMQAPLTRPGTDSQASKLLDLLYTQCTIKKTNRAIDTIEFLKSQLVTRFTTYSIYNILDLLYTQISIYSIYYILDLRHTRCTIYGERYVYGVATISRLLKMIGLFCQRAL